MKKNNFEDLKKEIKKATKFIPATLSYVFISFAMGYFFVVYLGLPKVFYATGLGISTFPALLDYFAGTHILVKTRIWWINLPITIHIWLIIDCFAYYFLLKSYLNDETIWINLSKKLQKN
ncbi:MAG: hypothetical protein ACD_18C00265G0002 [uncultured bacterium]|nr:MAG: hypothetical protein ACD_18C00265G0002 [uncultured bacterium]OGH84418.1 MAG: hypothetical protein A2488_01730 [Candidatus Magasanikbacteria bacterium RIFOXYC12_FULL_32_21b]OGH90740.1 MAG: hypothetical protein A2507_02670 [Candidatus Magasanikbacteria bacterium RIFOXYD12_FULL_33_17]HAO52238.1 hypothetical protein [Candidatus Magasanikbacteria bacterium]